MIKHFIAFSLLTTALFLTQVRAEGPAHFDQDHVREVAAGSESLFLSAPRRVESVMEFVRLLRIEGPSGKERAIRDAIKESLSDKGARLIPLRKVGATPPLNLAMEFPASDGMEDVPAILLNAHIDTIEESKPELLSFEKISGDFYHPHEKIEGASSSLGGDDRTGVAVIIEAIRTLRSKYWSRGVKHRRIILLFTAEEEIGLLGAKYLKRHQPELFDDIEISLTIDGPLDFRIDYPKHSIVAVVSPSDARKEPYKGILKMLGDFCRLTDRKLGVTRIGLGMGDFAQFPESAKAGLHLRSPVRGLHAKERVKIQDLINHIDLICYLLLDADGTLPDEIAEQGGADQPATAPESKPEGDLKPQPESKGRSQ